MVQVRHDVYGHSLFLQSFFCPAHIEELDAVTTSLGTVVTV
jgi:hypothetical protein